MKLRINPFLYLLSISLGIILLSSPVLAKKVNITILYTNDVHGHVLPFDDPYQGKDAGGIARRVTLIKQIKKQNPNTLV
ncbi:MAG: hypothetical protein QME64_12495, partial [bacterium]|nr:hypothetical protein [bacterium]